MYRGVFVTPGPQCSINDLCEGGGDVSGRVANWPNDQQNAYHCTVHNQSESLSRLHPRLKFNWVYTPSEYDLTHRQIGTRDCAWIIASVDQIKVNSAWSLAIGK